MGIYKESAVDIGMNKWEDRVEEMARKERRGRTLYRKC